jgi:hypothetical protein
MGEKIRQAGKDPQNENVAVRKDVQSMFFILVIVICGSSAKRFVESLQNESG